MDFFHKNQKVILTIVLLLGAYYVYSTYFKKDITTATQDSSAQDIGNEVLGLYNSLQSVTLDQSLFSYSLYKKLVDFSVSIPEQIPGRPNPFDPIGRD